MALHLRGDKFQVMGNRFRTHIYAVQRLVSAIGMPSRGEIGEKSGKNVFTGNRHLAAAIPVLGKRGRIYRYSLHSSFIVTVVTPRQY